MSHIQTTKNIQLQIHKYRYIYTTIHKYKYTNTKHKNTQNTYTQYTNTQIQLRCWFCTENLYWPDLPNFSPLLSHTGWWRSRWWLWRLLITIKNMIIMITGKLLCLFGGKRGLQCLICASLVLNASCFLEGFVYAVIVLERDEYILKIPLFANHF